MNEETNVVYEGEVLSAEETESLSEPAVEFTDLSPTSDTSNGTSALAVAGIVAVAGAVGFGAYKGIKKLKVILDEKSKERSIKKLEKRGYIIIPQRDPIEDDDDISEVEEEAFVDEEVSETKETPKKKK